MPHLTKLFNEYPDSLIAVIGINVPDRPKKVEREVKQNKLPYPVLNGRGSSVARDFKVPQLPYIYIINQNGVVHSGDIFFLYDYMKESIEELRGAKPAK